MAKKIDIAGQLNSAAADNKLADASQIYDSKKGKFQEKFNEDIENKVESYKQELEQDVNNAVANLVGGASETFDTLKEFEDWINNDESGATAIAKQTNDNKTDISDLNANTGISEYSAFDPAEDYAVGDAVVYEGRLKRFTADHAAGEWIGTDVESWSERKEREEKVRKMKSIFVKPSAKQSDIDSLINDFYIKNADKNKEYILESFQYNTQYSEEKALFFAVIVRDSISENTKYYRFKDFVWTDYIENDDVCIRFNKESQYYGVDTFLFIPRLALNIDKRTADVRLDSVEKSVNNNKNDILKNNNRINSIGLKTFIPSVKDEFGVNIVNPTTIEKNVYINTSGEIKETKEDSYTISDYIEVKGRNIICNSKLTVFGVYVVYDKYGKFLRSINSPKYEYIDGDAYVRIAFYDGNEFACYGDILLGYEEYMGIAQKQEKIYKKIFPKKQIKELKFSVNDFPNIGVLSKGIFKNEAVSSGYSEYRVTDYIDISGIDYIEYVGLISISGYSSVAFYSSNSEEYYIGDYTNRDGNIEVSDYYGAKYARFCKYYSIDSKIELFSLKWEEIDIIEDLLIQINTLNRKCSNFVVVSKDGNGDYDSLEDAMLNVQDSKDNPVTIFVLPGKYEMKEWNNDYVGRKSNRHLNIIGINKNQCILYNNKGAYNYESENYVDNACLKIAGNCLIKNLTIINTAEEFDEATHGNLWKRSYNIHLDAAASDGDIMVIENCTFYNDHFSCLGCGTKTGYSIKVENCEFHHHSDYPDWDFASVIYAHDASGNERQMIEITNSKIVSDNAHGVYVSNTIGNTEVKVEFRFNAVSVIKEKLAYCPGGNPVLSELSFGNNHGEMNYV